MRELLISLVLLGLFSCTLAERQKSIIHFFSHDETRFFNIVYILAGIGIFEVVKFANDLCGATNGKVIMCAYCFIHYVVGTFKKLPIR